MSNRLAEFGRVLRPFLLVANILVVLALTGSVYGASVYFPYLEPGATVSSPPVFLQAGTAGSSTIYANSTSAKVSLDSTGWGSWSDELLVNSGFEMGNLSGWTAKGPAAASVEVFNATSGGDIYTNRTLRIGNYGVCTLDTPGTNDDSGIWQNVTVTAYSSAIDAGSAVINASAWLYPSEWEWDDVALIVRFYNSSGSFLGAWNTTGEYGNGTAYYPQAWMLGNGYSHFVQGQLKQFGCYNYTIPVGTRTVGIQLGMGEHVSPAFYCGGQADEASIKIRTRAPDIEDYVDNNSSDVDSSADIGTHSNFTAQQYGPDSIYDTLSEADTGGNLVTYDYGSGAGSNKWAYKGETTSVPPSSGPDITGQTGANYTQIASSDNARDSFGPASAGFKPYFNLKFTITEDNITQLNLLFEGYPVKANVYIGLYLWNFTGSTWDIKNSISAIGGQDENFTATVTTGIANYIDANDHLYFLVVDDNNKGTLYCDYVKAVVTFSTNYELDLEVQWTNADFDETNEYLCISGGAMGAEDIAVEAWNGSAWKTLLTDLSSGWNNVSVSSYLTSSTFTIRFNDANETGDVTQDVWNVDAALLHVWTYGESTYDYVLRVNNTVTDSWKIRLKKYADSDIDRLQNCTIYFHNSSDGTSKQIAIENGSFINVTGSWYDLGSLETVYIAMTVEASSAGTSYVYAYLEILIENTTTYAQYIITFRIT